MKNTDLFFGLIKNSYPIGEYEEEKLGNGSVKMAGSLIEEKSNFSNDVVRVIKIK